MANEALTTTRSHAMCFGTEIRPDGVLFRLWAPGARTVECALERADGTIGFSAMTDLGGGWHQWLSSQARVGSLYRFRIDKQLLVPDPAARCQADDVHGPSVVIDPKAFSWRDVSWKGRPWEEAIIYELHVGAFSPDGSFSGMIERLDYLVELGVTAVELMPVADFPGQRNWGYDGALLFAPDRAYGSPEDLKSFIQEAHSRNLMVVLDVVYNHFGPEGNYLYVYAKDAFFNPHRHTPWGDAIQFGGEMRETVRRFFIDNALYWLEEFHVDGLRLDAVHAIFDDSAPHILEEIGQAVRNGPGRHRHIHLVLENDNNEARYLCQGADHRDRFYNAQWNDDIHHCCHVLLTGEQQGYYGDYARRPLALLGRCLTEGFAYQGEISAYRNNQPRGERSRSLPLTAFVSFLQNHDQVGNRALGERLHQLAPEPLLQITVALLLLAPSPPLLFMGEEFSATTPFFYFCDFGPDLAGKVKDGRRQEFSRFPEFADVEARERIPDPNQPATFSRSRLDWGEPEQGRGRAMLRFYQKLLALRRKEIIPRLAGLQANGAGFALIGKAGLHVHWKLAGRKRLEVFINFSDAAISGVPINGGTLLYCLPTVESDHAAHVVLAPQSICYLLKDEDPL
jgi:malto-oligosyltrehalose trehalohydrolase